MLKRILLTLSLLTACALHGMAQENAVSGLLSSFPEGKCVRADYELTVTARGNAGITYSGKLWWQDGLFRIVGDGYSIYCNGVHVWTVDSEAGEIVRERAAGIDELIPSAGTGESEIEVVRSPDGKRISSVSMKMKNGASVLIDVPSMVFIAPEPVENFTFDEGAVPADFVFTVLD